jgi:hypothetical protein
MERIQVIKNGLRSKNQDEWCTWEDIEWLIETVEKQQKEIKMLDGAVAQDDETKTRYANEIGELISLNLWSARRLKHQQYKDFAYDELEKITRQKHDRV